LVAASNGGCSPSFRFPNCPRPQLRPSNSNSSQRLNPSSPLTHQLTDRLPPLTFRVYNISARIAQKIPFLCSSAVFALDTCLFAEPLLSSCCFIVVYFAVVAWQRVYMPQYNSKYVLDTILLKYSQITQFICINVDVSYVCWIY
jgi:hypothetical protein